MVCERVCFHCEYVLEEDPEAHPEERDGHGANDRTKLQDIRSKKATAQDSGEDTTKQPHERVVHEYSSAGHHDEAVDFLKRGRIALLERPVLVPEEAVSSRKQHSDRVISKCFPGNHCRIEPQQEVQDTEVNHGVRGPNDAEA